MSPKTVRSPADLAAALNVTARTVRNWLRYPTFPKAKRGAWDLAEVVAWARRMRSETKDRTFGGGRRVAGARKVRTRARPPAAELEDAPPPASAAAAPPAIDELEPFADLGQGARRVDDPRMTKIRLQNVILADTIKKSRESMISRAELAKMFTLRMREWRRHLLNFARAVAPKIVGCPDVKFIEATVQSEVLKLLWLAYGSEREAGDLALDLSGTKRDAPGEAEPESPSVTPTATEPDSGPGSASSPA